VRTNDFAEIAETFHERVTRVIYCSVATVDALGRPRSRILHPIWEGHTAWITTDPRSFKRRHLATNPHVSLAYIADPAKPVYVDGCAEWVTAPVQLQHVWDLCLNTPPPVGFDPAPIYGSVDPAGREGPHFGALKITPYRITLYGFPDPTIVWTPAESIASG